jgi:hypothetical protein
MCAGKGDSLPVGETASEVPACREIQRMTGYIIWAIAIALAFLVARTAARWDMRAWVGQHRAKRELRQIAKRERSARWR